ncbi:hypothetical protein D3C72_1700890 [compost metagenome]
MNRSLCSGISFSLIARAVSASPLRAASHRSAISRGATLAVTEMLPLPPIRISSTAVGSSPDSTMKSLLTPSRMALARLRSPVASLIPMMFGTVDRRITVSACMSQEVRPGTL